MAFLKKNNIYGSPVIFDRPLRLSPPVPACREPQTINQQFLGQICKGNFTFKSITFFHPCSPP